MTQDMFDAKTVEIVHTATDRAAGVRDFAE